MIHRVLLALILGGIAASAQTVSSAGVITGVVVDQSEAVISGAQVTLQETRQTTKTDGAGRFRFERITPGEYQLLVTSNGFKPETISLTLTLRPLAPLRVVMNVAEVQQEMSVSDNAAQVSVEDSNNFNPRFSVAWAADKARKTVVRGGFGFFYDRTGPGPISDFLRFDGKRLRRYVITNPGFPDPLANGQSLAGQPNSIVRLAPDTVIPFMAQYSIGVERQLQKSLALTLSYIGTRGVKLLRSRDVNAPLPMMMPPQFTARPDPNFTVIRQIESTGRMTGHSLEVGLRGAISRYFNGMIQYVFGRAWNDTSGINAFPANSYDLTGEWGRADFDIRHRFNLLGTVKAGKIFNLGMNLALNTGVPYTLTTGRDENKDSQALDRPAGVGRNTLEGPGLEFRKSSASVSSKSGWRRMARYNASRRGISRYSLYFAN